MGQQISAPDVQILSDIPFADDDDEEEEEDEDEEEEESGGGISLETLNASAGHVRALYMRMLWMQGTMRNHDLL